MDPLDNPYGDPLPMDLELLCGELLSDWLISRDLKKALRGKVVFIKPDESGLFELRWKGVRKVDDKHIAVARKKYPDATILNALPFKEAVELYQKNS